MVARTGRPQPTQSSNTVPSLFIPPFGVPTTEGSLGGVPGLEPDTVLCDAVAVIVALESVGACTRCRHWCTAGKGRKAQGSPCVIPSVQNPSRVGKMKPPAIPCLQLHTFTSVRSTTVSSPLERNVLCVADVAFPPIPRHLLV